LTPRDTLSASATKMASAAAQVARVMLLHRPLPLKGSVGRTLLQHALSHVVSESGTVDQDDEEQDEGGGTVANLVEYDDEARHSSATVPPCPSDAAWEVAVYSMRILEGGLGVPFLAEAATQSIVRALTEHPIMLHAQHRVRVGSAKLLGHVLAAVARSSSSASSTTTTTTTSTTSEWARNKLHANSGGGGGGGVASLMDDDAQHHLLRKLCRQLEGSYLNVDLTNTVVRNLVYLGRQTWNVGEGPASAARVGTVTTSFRPLNWCVLMFVVLIVFVCYLCF
jgi:hypothetical protein